MDNDIIEMIPPELAQKLKGASRAVKIRAAEILSDMARAKRIESARDDFTCFVKEVWPGFISGRHHQIMGDAFGRIVSGDLKRLIICMPPRHTKSEYGSIHLPAWYLGHFPSRKIIQTAHTAELSTGFGRKVRDLVNGDEYKAIFPDTTLSPDAKAAGRWQTTRGGDYFAIGVGGAVTGKGADLLIIDDAHSEQEGSSLDPSVFDKTYEWYTSGPRQRLQPGAAIVIIMTRWSTRDLVGRIIKDSTSRGRHDEWEIIEFPAIMPSGKPLWPEFWPIEELLALKAELPTAKWNAQYQQTPTAEEGALIKREWWRKWKSGTPPTCEFVIQSWDTAFLKTERADYSACTTWGVFYHPDDDGKKKANLILLDAYKARLEFPELKKKAFMMWNETKPDAFIVEAKASGQPLIFELRQMGIPVAEFKPSRGNDKIARVNAIADLFASGIVWAPETRFAEEVIEEFAAFPVGEHDDLVDSATQAMLRFRQGGFIRAPSDEEEEDENIKRPQRADYY